MNMRPIAHRTEPVERRNGHPGLGSGGARPITPPRRRILLTIPHCGIESTCSLKLADRDGATIVKVHVKEKGTLVYPYSLLHPEDWLRFVQMGPFTRKWARLDLTDDDLIHLEMSIMVSPTTPPVVSGTGGLRKMRFAPPSWHTGKRGALRVCYVFFQDYSIVLLVTFFPKNEKSDLNAAERKEIAKLIREIEDYVGSEEVRTKG